MPEKALRNEIREKIEQIKQLIRDQRVRIRSKKKYKSY